MVEVLLTKGAYIEAKNDDGETPLHTASSNDHANVAEVLLAKGAYIKAKDDGRLRPLHRASNIGHDNVAELLLAKGADIEANGRTPLYLAYSKPRNRRKLAHQPRPPRKRSHRVLMHMFT